MLKSPPQSSSDPSPAFKPGLTPGDGVRSAPDHDLEVLMALHALRTPLPKRCPKRATKSDGISIKTSVPRRTFCTNLEAGFRWPFAPLRSVKIWPRKRGQIISLLTLSLKKGHLRYKELPTLEQRLVLRTFPLS